MFDDKIKQIIGEVKPFDSLKEKALSKAEIEALNARKIEQLKKKSDAENIVKKII